MDYENPGADRDYAQYNLSSFSRKHRIVTHVGESRLPAAFVEAHIVGGAIKAQPDRPAGDRAAGSDFATSQCCSPQCAC